MGLFDIFRSKTSSAGSTLPYPAYDWMREDRVGRGTASNQFQAEAGERKSKARGFLEPSLYTGEGFGKTVGESSYGRGREYYGDIASGGITGASYGRGREGYEEFSRTGGFSPGEKEQFLRRSSAVPAAFYARNKDELNRRLSVQGGYMPGFTSSQARLTRQGAQAGAEATLGANVALSEQVRAGRIQGLGGLERTREAAGKEHLEGVRGLERTRESAGGEAMARMELAQYGLNQLDSKALMDRISRGEMDQRDIQILADIREKSPSLYSRIMQISGSVAGAVVPFLGGGD